MSSILTIEKLEYGYLDQSSSVKSILLNQTFSDYNLKLNKSNFCDIFEETTNYINIRITYSPRQRISVLELRFKVIFVKNATINELNITLSLGPFRKCIVDKRTEYSNHRHFWTFICELNSLRDYRILHYLIEFLFISKKTFQLAICGINVYFFQGECGIPDVPLHASYYRRGSKSFQYFSTNQRNKHLMIGDGVITCLNEGNWDKEPPIFEPIIKCNTNEINMTSKLYKDFKLENFEFFNKTEVAVIDSKIIFKCYNEENSSQTHVSICNENGLWIGDDFKCKKVNLTTFKNVSFISDETNNYYLNKSHLFSIIIIFLLIVVFVLIICIIIGTTFIMRLKKLRKKKRISEPQNTNDLELYEAHDDTNNEDYHLYEDYDYTNYESDPNYYLTIVA